jgi:hypothetical protein
MCPVATTVAKKRLAALLTELGNSLPGTKLKSTENIEHTEVRKYSNNLPPLYF